jgi:hypothetical protein
VSTRASLTEGELSQPLWWCNHHKEAVRYLVIRIHQLLHDEATDPSQIESILRATLPAFAESVGVDLDEVKIS